MIAPSILDPFETETTLAQEPRTLSFTARGFELPMEELLRHLAFDLVGAIPRPLGELQEDLPDTPHPIRFATRFFQVGAPVLAITTEITQGPAEHRVLELLGVGENTRIRLNLTRYPDTLPTHLDPESLDALRNGGALGQVHIWAREPSIASDIRRVIARQMQHAGLGGVALGRHVAEPIYRPPAATTLHLDALPSDDLKVTDALLGLLASLPAPNAHSRPPRRIGVHRERLRRDTSIVSYHYEIHRAATGVLHLRRREVEAGVERPGLVRTFNLAGLQGGARLRIRDIGGRAYAEFAGAQASVDIIRTTLQRSMGGRA